MRWAALLVAALVLFALDSGASFASLLLVLVLVLAVALVGWMVEGGRGRS